MISSESGSGRSSPAIEDLDLDLRPDGSALAPDTALDRPTSASAREAGGREAGGEIDADNWRHIVADLFPSVRV